ncbi:MAG TPA: cell wall-binding repeat-containing protein [Acidimicrobiales bacterium]|nr:cell wall-binding repeat-containing protein [Acidimicrobiales bacterium]
MTKCSRVRPLRVLAAAVGLSLVGSVLAVYLPAAPTSATAAFAMGRLGGADRYATSALVAERAFAVAPTVILATGTNYPDALAASYLAGNIIAPILLTTPDLPLSPSTTAALGVLGTRNLILVGGTSAISAAEQATLSQTYSVTRVSGATRYDTMAAVDQYPGTSVSVFQGLRTAFLATGRDFPDAVGAGPIAYAKKFPIILTDSATLSSQAVATLTALGIQQVIILGGMSAILPAVEAAVNGMGITTLVRFAGADRSDTSAKLADYAIANLGFKSTVVNLASGDEALGGADALSAGPLGGSEDPVVTLVTLSVSGLGSAVGFATEHALTLTNGLAIGSSAALSDALLGQFSAAAGGTGSGSGSGGGGATGTAGVACGTPPTVGTGGSTGESTQTVRPQLTNVALVSLTTSTQATLANPAGLVLRFSFSSPVTGAPPVKTDFFLQNADATNPPANAPATASVEPSNTSAVDVYFPGIHTQAAFDNLGVAGVVPNAVQDLAVPSRTNPEASAPIGGHLNLVAGRTDTPDIQSFGGFRAGLAAGVTMVDLTFDCAAVPTGTVGYNVVLTDNSVHACSGPAPASTNPSGGNAVGGVGTTVITVSCPYPVGTNNPAFGGVPLTQAEVARFFVNAGTLTDTSGGPPNPLESAGTTATTCCTPAMQWLAPDLVSATAMPNQVIGGITRDQVVVNFDVPIFPPGTSAFSFFTISGTASTPTAVSITSPYNGNQQSVLATYPAGTLANVVGTYVTAGVVQSAVGSNNTNQPQSFGIVGTAQTSPTSAPDFVSASKTGANTVMFTFDKAPTVASAAGFNIYLPDGSAAAHGSSFAAPVGNTVTITFVPAVAGYTLATVSLGAGGVNAPPGGGAI